MHILSERLRAFLAWLVEPVDPTMDGYRDPLDQRLRDDLPPHHPICEPHRSITHSI